MKTDEPDISPAPVQFTVKINLLDGTAVWTPHRPAIPGFEIDLRPVPDKPGHHLLFVGGQQISGFDDTPNPAANDTQE